MLLIGFDPDTHTLCPCSLTLVFTRAHGMQFNSRVSSPIESDPVPTISIPKTQSKKTGQITELSVDWPDSSPDWSRSGLETGPHTSRDDNRLFVGNHVTNQTIITLRPAKSLQILRVARFSPWYDIVGLNTRFTSGPTVHTHGDPKVPIASSLRSIDDITTVRCTMCTFSILQIGSAHGRPSNPISTITVSRHNDSSTSHLRCL